MFSWVCSRCGHEVPPSKTECPFCFPATTESASEQAPPQQYQPPQPPPPQQLPPQQQPGAPQYPAAPPQYGQQGPPQYWQPQPPPQYMPPGQPQYWQPQGTYQMPGQPYPQAPYPPSWQPPPQQETKQYQPAAPPELVPQQQYAPPPQPQYQPPIVADVRKAEPTPWPAPEEREGKPTWLIALLTIIGVLALFGVAYYLTSSHGSSAAKDAAAKDQPANPLQKYIEVDGIRLVDSGRDVKFFVVNHGANEISDLGVKVTLWASTQRSEEDSVGSFTFHLETLASNDAKEMTASLKTDKQSYELPDDWRNMSADVQITSGQ